jgi:hypothetical protein
MKESAQRRAGDARAGGHTQPPNMAEPQAKKRPEIVEPPLGLGRDIEISVARAPGRFLRGALMLLGLGFVFIVGGDAIAADRPHDGRGLIVEGCGVLLLFISFYAFGMFARHRGRGDLVLRLDREVLDLPVLAFAGPMRFTERLAHLHTVGVLANRNATWIQVSARGGQKAIIPAQWLEGSEDLLTFATRLELRATMARAHGGKIPRAALAGSEAMALLARGAQPIFGVVVDKVKSKRPKVLALVDSFDDYFAHLAEWPEESKLVVLDDVREKFLAELGALGDEASKERAERLA